MSTDQAPTPQAFPDRSNRLMVAGIFEIVLGGICLLFVPMMGVMLAAQSKLQPAPGGTFGPAMFVQGMVTYLVAAVVFVSVGINLIRARRWAWALTVVGSWIWLVIGLLCIVPMLLMQRATSAMIAQEGHAPPGFMIAMQIMTLAIMAGIYIVAPGILLVLCHGESARATCKRLDPQPRWTDRCPLPVLAISLLNAFSAVSLLSPVTWRSWLVLLGIDVSLIASAAIGVLLACLTAWLAWGMYRLLPAAWWVELVVILIGSAVMFVMFRAMDLSEMYKKLGLPADQIEKMRKAGLFDVMSSWGPWLGLAAGVAWVGYLVFLRRYFSGARELRGHGTIEPKIT